MFTNQSFRLKRLVSVLSVLLMTAVTLAHSDAGSLLLLGIQIVVNRQPQGF